MHLHTTATIRTAFGHHRSGHLKCARCVIHRESGPPKRKRKSEKHQRLRQQTRGSRKNEKEAPFYSTSTFPRQAQLSSPAFRRGDFLTKSPLTTRSAVQMAVPRTKSRTHIYSRFRNDPRGRARRGHAVREGAAIASASRTLRGRQHQPDPTPRAIRRHT